MTEKFPVGGMMSLVQGFSSLFGWGGQNAVLDRDLGVSPDASPDSSKDTFSPVAVDAEAGTTSIAEQIGTPSRKLQRGGLAATPQSHLSFKYALGAAAILSLASLNCGDGRRSVDRDDNSNFCYAGAALAIWGIGMGVWSLLRRPKDSPPKIEKKDPPPAPEPIPDFALPPDGEWASDDSRVAEYVEILRSSGLKLDLRKEGKRAIDVETMDGIFMAIDKAADQGKDVGIFDFLERCLFGESGLYFTVSKQSAYLISEELGWMSASSSQSDRLERMRETLRSWYPKDQRAMDGYYDKQRRYALMHAQYAGAPVWDYGFDPEKLERKFKPFYRGDHVEHRGLYAHQKLRVILDHARDVVGKSGRSNQEIGNRLKRVLQEAITRGHKSTTLFIDGQGYEVQCNTYRNGGTSSPFFELRKDSPSLPPGEKTNAEILVRNLTTGQAIRCTPHLPGHIADFGCYIEASMDSSAYDPRFQPNVEKVFAVLGLELPPA